MPLLKLLCLESADLWHLYADVLNRLDHLLYLRFAHFHLEDSNISVTGKTKLEAKSVEFQ